VGKINSLKKANPATKPIGLAASSPEKSSSSSPLKEATKSMAFLQLITRIT
jgi:hypothetical protein